MFYLTPLHFAVRHNKIEIIKLLLNHDNIDLNAVDSVFHSTFIKFFFRIYGKKPVELTDKEEIIQLFNEKLQEEEEEK